MPARQAREVVAGYADLVAPGSYVVISCVRCDNPAMWRDLRKAYTAGDAYNHATGTVRRFLAGLEFVPPGLVPATAWRPARPACLEPGATMYVLAGVARKP